MPIALLVAMLILIVAGSSARADGTHTIASGETLFSIARAELGDGNRWRELAELNAIADPARLQVGAVLKLPIRREGGSIDHGARGYASSQDERASSRGPITAVVPPSPSETSTVVVSTPVARTAALPADPWISSVVESSDDELEALIRLGLSDNPRIARARAAADGSEAQVRAALSAYMPTIGASERFTSTDNAPMAFMSILQQGRMTPAEQMKMNDPGRVEDWTTNLYARALLVDFGMRRGQLDAARADEERLRWMESAARRDVRFAIEQSYYRLLTATASVKLWEETVRVFEAHERIAAAHFEAGAVLRSDLLSVRVRLGDARENLSAARHAVEIVKAELAAATGDASRPITVSLRPLGRPSYDRDEERLVRSARQAHPVISATTAAERAAAAMERSARGSHLPRLMGEVSGEWHGDDENFGTRRESYMAALVLDVPLFDGWRTRALRDRARAQAREAAAMKRELADALEVAVRTAHRRSLEAIARTSIADDAVAAAREALAIIEERYRAGLARVDELLEVERNLTEARVRALEARAAAWTALAAVRLAADEEESEQ